MCGILGVFRPGGLGDGEAMRLRLAKAGELIAYRGPDAAGTAVSSDGRAAFGHRRLAILDLDARANQPMHSGPLLLTYNGEIYNFRELKKELAASGASFRTESDTEVLLEGYRAWGMDGLLKRAAGMFAFALYDADRGALFLARDRAGKKPLYYFPKDGGVVFASEMRALLFLAPESRTLSPEGLDAWLQLKFSPSPGTLFQGVHKLPPGHWLEFNAHGTVAASKAYWHPMSPARVEPRSEKAWSEAVEAALSTAVERRLVSDVPVCLFLSGGVDSGLVAERLAALGRSDMTAYSIGYGDKPEYDEFEFARMTARRFGLKHKKIVYPLAEAQALLKDDALVLDDPVSDWVWAPLHELSKRARADGYKVVLMGEGADEAFCGYGVMMDAVREARFYQSPAGCLAAIVAANLLSPLYRWSSRGHRRYDRWRRVAAGEPASLGSSVGFPRSQRLHVAGEKLRNAGDPGAASNFIADLQAAFAAQAPDPKDLVTRACFVEFYAKMTETLLHRVDRITMRHSIEARAPFLDQDLLSLAFALPGPLKTPQGRLKGFLKNIARKRLPAEVVDRPKMGFSFPYKEWLRGELGQFTGEVFAGARLFSDGWVNRDFALGLLSQHRSGVDHAPRIWQLFTLARWYERWIVGGGA